MRTLLLAFVVILVSSCSSITERPKDSEHRFESVLATTQSTHAKSIISTNTSAAQSTDCMSHSCLTIIVANVGQGSGAVAELPNNEKMLIDAGYSANPHVGTPLENIKWAANQIGVNHNAPFDYVVLSHPDKDHVNLVDKLFEQGYISLTSTKSLHIGRLPKEYATTMKAKAFFDAIYEVYPTHFTQCNDNKKINVRIVVNCYDEAGVVPTTKYQETWPHDAEDGWASYMISVNAGGNGSDKVNSNSLVVGFYHGDKVVGILPGDATEVTTNAILASAPNNTSMYSDAVLYAISHHGADTHGSNKLNWLEVLKSKIYIASNSRYGKWRHPSNKITRDILNNLDLSDAILSSSEHKLFQAYELNGNAAFCYCNDFKKSIYSTFSNGWLRIVVDGTGAIDSTFQSDDILPSGYFACEENMCK